MKVSVFFLSHVNLGAEPHMSANVTDWNPNPFPKQTQQDFVWSVASFLCWLWASR